MQKMASVLALSLVTAFVGLSHAQAAKRAKGQRRGGAQGKVASIDAAKKTLTLNDRKGTTTTVSFTDQTKVMKAEAGKVADLKGGDVVTVQGTVAGTSVEARSILVMPSSTRVPRKAPQNLGRRGVRGSVSSTAPLKVRMGDTEYDVKTTEATRVLTMKEGAAADIKVGDLVRVQGQPGSDGVLQAQTIQVSNLAAGGKVKGAKRANRKANKKAKSGA